ncbi:MAG: type VI secretion system baseplate subunit TssF [Tannerella sp.]|jgi:hypothetical protein|nr:type VI secretion system baseplate subunit TssF [Tannerella sp.]
MNDQTKYYKEVIKNRMYKRAAAIWGVRDIDNFDPVLKLMVESLAGEINKLSNELDNLEARLLERLAGTLTPDTFLTVRPAHAILHAKPAEEQIVICKSSVFQYKTKDARIFHFSPAGDFDLINGDVHALICAGQFFRMDNQSAKEMHVRSRKRSSKFTDSLWIGLHIHPSIGRIQNLSFYFDLPAIEKRNELLKLLPYSRWEQDGRGLSTRPGIQKASATHENRFPLYDYDPVNLSEESVLDNYSHRFITVRDEIVNHMDAYRILPEELTGLFPEVESETKPRPLLWLKITLPPGFEDYVLSDFFVSINAFPIINRKFYSRLSRTNPFVSVFRFETEENEYFLSVEQVSDSKSRKYIPLPHRNDENESGYGTYILKRGGAERFDARNAREFLYNLTDLLREENTSFSMYGKGFVDELVKRLDAELVKTELHLSKIKTDRDITSYLVIDSNDVGEHIYVDYWVTNCEVANGIKSGTPMLEFDGSQMDAKSLITLTQSYGGKQRRNHTPDMYKYSLTGRDHIVTDEDIMNFCYARFRDRITSAKVTKGILVSPRPKEGLIRSIDVHITLNKDADRGVSNHQDMEERLLSSLKKRSPETFYYRVFISNSNRDKP